MRNCSGYPVLNIIMCNGEHIRIADHINITVQIFYSQAIFMLYVYCDVFAYVMACFLVLENLLYFYACDSSHWDFFCVRHLVLM